VRNGEAARVVIDGWPLANRVRPLTDIRRACWRAQSCQAGASGPIIGLAVVVASGAWRASSAQAELRQWSSAALEQCGG